MSTSINPREIEHFSKDSHLWWDENGPFRPLHLLNPLRLRFIRDSIMAHFSLPENAPAPLKGLKILDVGCGGGLVCEPLARLGATITGIDADKNAIATAQSHAAGSGLDITYQATTTEALLPGDKNRFDVVVALEIVEHVANPGDFITSCAKLCKPGGLLILSTLNRTPKSFLLGIVAAEYVLRWVPQGTHRWNKFVRPSELVACLEKSGCAVVDIAGYRYNILAQSFELSNDDLSVNYILSAEKK